MKKTRKRKCLDCDKPLGSTVGRCFDCGGEQPEPSRKERLKPAEEWKMMMGIPIDMIMEAHDYDD